MRPAAYLILYLLLVFAVAAAFGSGRIRIGDDPETLLPWGNRVIETREELSSWLAARGSTYEEWRASIRTPRRKSSPGPLRRT